MLGIVTALVKVGAPAGSSVQTFSTLPCASRKFQVPVYAWFPYTHRSELYRSARLFPPPATLSTRGPPLPCAAVSVNPIGEPANPSTVACACWSPMVGPRMNWAEAVPSDPVVDEGEVMLPPPSTTAHVTVTP